MRSCWICSRSWRRRPAGCRRRRCGWSRRSTTADSPPTAGAVSTAALLRQVLNISAAEAGWRVTAAEKLLQRCSPSGRSVPAPLPATGGGLADGSIGAGQARLICDTIRRLPAGVDADTRARAEAFLASHARDLDTTALGKLARRMLATLDPDGAALDDEEAVRARELSLARGPDGMTMVRGRLDAEGAAVLRSALDPFTAPAPSTADGPDPRQPGPAAGGRADRTGPPRPHVHRPAGDRRAAAAGHRHRRLRDSPRPARRRGARLGRAGHPGVGPADRLRRATHPRPARHGRATPGRRAGPATPSPRGSVARWWPGTAAARSPAATGPPPGATDTTSPIGPTADPPRSPTWCCCAGTTTAPSTTTTGRSGSMTKAYPCSCRHPGSTPTRHPAATGCTTSPPCPTHPTAPTHPAADAPSSWSTSGTARHRAPYPHNRVPDASTAHDDADTADPRAPAEHRTRYPHNPA